MDGHRRALARGIRNDGKNRKTLEETAETANAIVHGKAPEEMASEARDAASEWLEDIRTGYQGGIIRRTIHSLDWQRRPISGLDDYHEILLLLKMTPQERLCQELLTERLARDSGIIRGKKLEVSLV